MNSERTGSIADDGAIDESRRCKSGVLRMLRLVQRPSEEEEIESLIVMICYL